MLSWLDGAFQTVLNMSIAAAVIIAAVLLARLLLRHAPKSFSYALWAVVLFRLLCPVSVSSAVSLLGLLDAPAQENTQYTTVIEYYAPPAEPQLSAPPVSASSPPAAPVVTAPATGGSPVSGQVYTGGMEPLEIASIVWALGVCAMLLYGAASYIRLRRSLVGNMALEGNIRLADSINSPFVLGIFRPKIYLPSDIGEGEREYIVLHERQHIRRGDHVFKVLAFIALGLHWFNPLVWLSFVLAGRDMEMSCDEAVLKKLGEGVCADYSASLLRFAAGRRGALSVPLAFGESGIKGRIKNLLRWKRPRAWISAAAALLCVFVLAACAVNPAADDGPARGEYGTAEDMAYCMELASGGEFQDMDAEILQQILDSNRGRTEGEAILARMSTDGRSAYVFRLNTGAEDDFTGYESTALSAGVTLLEPGGSLEMDPDSTTTLARLNMTNGTVLLFGEDRPGMLGRFALYNIFWEYLNGEDRPDYFEDAVSRGISFDVSSVDNAIAVNYIHPEFGAVSEMIPLTAEQADEIRASDRVSLALDETQFLAVLAAEGETADIYMADTGIPSAALEIIRAHCPVDPTAASAQTASPLAVARGEYGTAGDLAYYIEYTAGGEFHDMDAARRDGILAEYGDLLNGYSFIARENADGDGYIVGQYNGDPSSSPLNDMSSMEIDGITFALYPTDEYDAFMDARQAGEVPENVIVPQRSTLEWAINAYTVVIRPRDNAVYINTYNYTSDGIDYLEDARARGVSTTSYNMSEPYLRVYYINETYGETYEYIQLTDAEAEAMLAEEREPVEGFGAMLFYNGERTSFSGDYDGGVPRSAIDLAVERCGYKFVSPADITGDIVEARLDWLGEPIYADEVDLPRLRSLLVNAEKGYMGKCGYGAKLTLTLSSGEQVVAYKGTDSCDSICFGSCNGYFLGGDAANDEFWSIFGMGRMPNSNEVILDSGRTAYAALYTPAGVYVEWASGGYTSGFLAGLDESYNISYDGGYTGAFGSSGMFLALRGMPAAGSAPVSLFVSTDGGASWRTMGDPYRQGVYTGVMTGAGFYDADTAFLCYRYYEDAGPTVYCTYDGGGSWSRLAVELPAQYASDRSRWVFTPSSPEFDGMSGVIPVEVLDQDTGETAQLRLVTSDGGRAWEWE